MHYDACTNDGDEDIRTAYKPAKALSQLLGALVSLQTLALELELDPLDTDITVSH